MLWNEKVLILTDISFLKLLKTTEINDFYLSSLKLEKWTIFIAGNIDNNYKWSLRLKVKINDISVWLN